MTSTNADAWLARAESDDGVGAHPPARRDVESYFENVSELDIMINSGLVRGPNGSFATDMNLSRGVPSKERFMSDL